MLVLSRKIQEKIRVGENITITVLKVSGRSVRIGIDAPKDVRVLRAEIPLFSEEESQPNQVEVSGPVAEPQSTTDHSTDIHVAAQADDNWPNNRTERPIVIGRRFRVIAPTPGVSILRAIPIT